MFGPNVRIFFFLLFFIPLLAEAKTYTLTGRSPIGLGFKAGIETLPEFSTIPGTSTHYSHFYAFEPYLDFDNFILRFSGAFHAHPLRKGIGTDANGYYSDTSEASSFHYGIQFLLIPHVSKDNMFRTFFFLGLGKASASITSQRNYSNASNTITATNKEKLSGSKEEVNIGAGLEFMLVQNYSMVIEGGYRRVNFDRLTYESATDLEGNPRLNGDVAKDYSVGANGANKKFDLSGYFGNIGLNIRF